MCVISWACWVIHSGCKPTSSKLWVHRMSVQDKSAVVVAEQAEVLACVAAAGESHAAVQLLWGLDRLCCPHGCCCPYCCTCCVGARVAGCCASRSCSQWRLLHWPSTTSWQVSALRLRWLSYASYSSVHSRLQSQVVCNSTQEQHMLSFTVHVARQDPRHHPLSRCHVSCRAAKGSSRGLS